MLNPVTTGNPEQPELSAEQAARQILAVAVHAGEIMLRSGAEISRVELTITTLVKAFGIPDGQSLVTPTGIYVSIDLDSLPFPLSVVRRVGDRQINLNRISKVNDLSRRAARGQVTLTEARHELDQIEHSAAPYPFWLRMLAGAASAAGATLVIGGSALDCIPAFASTLLVQLLAFALLRLKVPAIFGEFFGAALATAIALLLARSGLPIHTSMVIAGGIIILVPGAALVACVQDGISGDLLSSASRGLETLLKGAAIASGVGLSLSAALKIGLPVSLETTTREIWQMPVQVLAAIVASGCYAMLNHVPRFAVLTAGTAGGVGWLVYLLVSGWNQEIVLATFLAAFVIGLLSWGFARWQHSPVSLYILPGILPLLPGLVIYNGMLQLAHNQSLDGFLVLAQATFIGGALAAGVALSNSLAPALWRKPGKFPSLPFL